MDELKQELEMDEHRIPIEELYARLGTNPDSVSSPSQNSIPILYPNPTSQYNLEG